MAYDLLIKNGRVIDGSGAPGFHGDVGVKDGKIAGVGKLNESATRTINAEGRVVSPGWIDNHTHYDAHALFDPLCSNSAQNGHTSVVVGDCGVGLAPARQDDPDFVRQIFSTELGPLEVLRAGVDVTWGPVAGYLSALGNSRGINVGALIGHSTVRHYVMGEESLERAANPEEIEDMREAVREGMLAGALGLSFSTNPNRLILEERTVPGSISMASHEERMAVADVLGELGIGTFQKDVILTPPEEVFSPLLFAKEISGRTGRPCSYNFIAQLLAEPEQWKEQLQRAEDAYHEGYRIYPMCLALPAGARFTFGHLTNMLGGTAIAQLFGGLPTWDAVLGQSREEKMGAFRNPETREKLSQEAASRPWDRIVIHMTEFEKNRALSGKSISQIAKEQGKDVVGCFLDLTLDDNLDTLFTLVTTNTDDDAIATIMNAACTTIGVSDGGAGPNRNDRYTYPAILLGHHVREKEAMSLEKAIYKLTSMGAMVFGITDRGLIREGLAADITIFDPETIAPLPPEPVYDLPGTGGMRIKQLSKGIDYTVVNGEVLMENAEHTGALPGTVLTNGLYGNNH